MTINPLHPKPQALAKTGRSRLKRQFLEWLCRRIDKQYGRSLNELQQTSGYLINAVKSFSETYVMPVLEDSWNKFNPPSNKLKL